MKRKLKELFHQPDFSQEEYPPSQLQEGEAWDESYAENGLEEEEQPSAYYEEESKLPDFLIHENSEVILFDYKNTFKLSNRNFLLKYKVNNCEQNFDKNNVDKNIILSEDIIRISAIDIGEYEYIYFSEDTLFGPISLNEAKNEFPNKDIYDYFIKDISYKE